MRFVLNRFLSRLVRREPVNLSLFLAVRSSKYFMRDGEVLFENRIENIVGCG